MGNYIQLYINPLTTCACLSITVYYGFDRAYYGVVNAPFAVLLVYYIDFYSLKEKNVWFALCLNWKIVLAAWMRLKYPHIAIGALASSAPILQFEDIVPLETFYDLLSNSFKVSLAVLLLLLSILLFVLICFLLLCIIILYANLFSVYVHSGKVPVVLTP